MPIVCTFYLNLWLNFKFHLIISLMVKSFVSLVEVVVDEKNNPVIVFRSSDGKPLEIAHNFEDCGDVLRSFLLTKSDK